MPRLHGEYLATCRKLVDLLGSCMCTLDLILKYPKLTYYNNYVCI